jgi:predicted ATPase
MKTKSSFGQAHTIKKIVLTGGPGVGKTSIVRCLNELKYDVREEVFTRLFAEAQKEGRFNDQFLISPQLIHDLLSSQISQEAQPGKGNLLFLDRSRIDIWGYSKNMGITPFEEDKMELENGDYDLVFVIEPLPKGYYDQNSIRRQSYQESLEHHVSVVQHYVDFLKIKEKDPNSCLIQVPFLNFDPINSVMNRTQYILQEIHRYFNQ